MGKERFKILRKEKESHFHGGGAFGVFCFFLLIGQLGAFIIEEDYRFLSMYFVIVWLFVVAMHYCWSTKSEKWVKDEDEDIRVEVINK